MGRASVKEDKNIYQQYREECGLTRVQASEIMEWISDNRIEKIEGDRTVATPEEIMAMSKAYKKPELCNYYCTHECAIGKKLIPEVQSKPIEKIVLEMIATLNNLEKQKDRLIEIASDGIIHDDEISDFIEISRQLDKIDNAVESLRLWMDKTVQSGEINTELLKKIVGEKGAKNLNL